jgi:hypothetical protein
MPDLPIKEQVIFDKILQAPETRKIRISAVNINVINEEVNVIYQLGNMIEERFEVKESRVEVFKNKDGDRYYDALMNGLKLDIPSLITALNGRIDNPIVLDRQE